MLTPFTSTGTFRHSGGTRLRHWSCQTCTAEHPLQREYTLIVEALSPEAYAYTKEVMAARGMASYFAEPARVYSNLSSGIGIFAAIARRQYPLTFTYKEAEEGGKAKVVISTQKGVKPSSVSASRRSR